MIEFLLTDDEGLWAQVRQQIIEELRTQDLTELGDENISEVLTQYAQEAMTEAIDGLNEGITEAGGYQWLLSQKEI